MHPPKKKKKPPDLCISPLSLEFVSNLIALQSCSFFPVHSLPFFQSVLPKWVPWSAPVLITLRCSSSLPKFKILPMRTVLLLSGIALGGVRFWTSHKRLQSNELFSELFVDGRLRVRSQWSYGYGPQILVLLPNFALIGPSILTTWAVTPMESTFSMGIKPAWWSEISIPFDGIAAKVLRHYEQVSAFALYSPPLLYFWLISFGLWRNCSMNWMDLLCQVFMLNGVLAMTEYPTEKVSCFWQLNHGYFVLDSANSFNRSWILVSVVTFTNLWACNPTPEMSAANPRFDYECSVYCIMQLLPTFLGWPCRLVIATLIHVTNKFLAIGLGIKLLWFSKMELPYGYCLVLCVHLLVFFVGSVGYTYWITRDPKCLWIMISSLFIPIDSWINSFYYHVNCIVLTVSMSKALCISPRGSAIFPSLAIYGSHSRYATCLPLYCWVHMALGWMNNLLCYTRGWKFLSTSQSEASQPLIGWRQPWIRLSHLMGTSSSAPNSRLCFAPVLVPLQAARTIHPWWLEKSTITSPLDTVEDENSSNLLLPETLKFIKLHLIVHLYGTSNLFNLNHFCRISFMLTTPHQFIYACSLAFPITLRRSLLPAHIHCSPNSAEMDILASAIFVHYDSNVVKERLPYIVSFPSVICLVNIVKDIFPSLMFATIPCNDKDNLLDS